MSIYNEQGYENRETYLKAVSEEFNIEPFIIEALSDVLGEEEDFDGLICALEDYEYFFDN